MIRLPSSANPCHEMQGGRCPGNAWWVGGWWLPSIAQSRRSDESGQDHPRDLCGMLHNSQQAWAMAATVVGKCVGVSWPACYCPTRRRQGSGVQMPTPQPSCHAATKTKSAVVMDSTRLHMVSTTDRRSIWREIDETPGKRWARKQPGRSLLRVVCVCHFVFQAPHWRRMRPSSQKLLGWAGRGRPVRPTGAECSVAARTRPNQMSRHQRLPASP